MLNEYAYIFNTDKGNINPILFAGMRAFKAKEKELLDSHIGEYFVALDEKTTAVKQNYCEVVLNYVSKGIPVFAMQIYSEPISEMDSTNYNPQGKEIGELRKGIILESMKLKEIEETVKSGFLCTPTFGFYSLPLVELEDLKILDRLVKEDLIKRDILMGLEERVDLDYYTKAKLIEHKKDGNSIFEINIDEKIYRIKNSSLIFKFLNLNIGDEFIWYPQSKNKVEIQAIYKKPIIRIKRFRGSMGRRGMEAYWEFLRKEQENNK